MLVAFDTSVIVAATLTQHQFHARAWPWLQAVELGQLEACVCVHALAEVYSVLTKIPGAMTPADGYAVVSRLPGVFTVHATNHQTYMAAIDRCSDRGLRSGAVYDALHLLHAEQASADLFLTFNPSHFLRLAAPERPKIVVPPEPPSLEISP